MKRVDLDSRCDEMKSRMKTDRKQKVQPPVSVPMPTIQKLRLRRHTRVLSEYPPMEPPIKPGDPYDPQKLKARVNQLKDLGFSFGEIATIVTRDGFQPRSKRSNGFSSGTIHSIWTRP